MTRARDVANIDGILTTKGDIYAATAASTPARLGVGSNGEQIVADSSTSTGLRWQVPVNVNPVLNSSFQIWQRGTSFTYGGGGIAYQADRWQGWGTGGGSAYTVTRQATGDTTNLPNIQYCLRMQRPAGNTNTDFWALLQSIETVNSIPYAGKTVTLSFYARKGANFSGASSLLNSQLLSGTGTDQNASGFTGSTQVIGVNSTLTTTWQRFSYTGTVSSTATQLGLNFNFQGAGTAGAADYFEITGVQIEVGSVATPFKTYAGTIQGELAACQRYYQRYTSSSDLYVHFFIGIATSSTQVRGVLTIPPMRTKIASIDYGGSFNAVGTTGALTLQGPGSSNTGVNIAVTGATTNQMYLVYANNDANAYYGFSAEL